MDKYDVTVLRIAYGSNNGASIYTLPENISTMPQPSMYLPDIIKIGVPCGVAGIVAIAGVLTGIIVLTKKRKAKKNSD